MILGHLQVLTLIFFYCVFAQPREPGPPPKPAAEPNPMTRPIGRVRDALFRDISIGHCRCSPSLRGHPPLDAPDVRVFVERLQVVTDTNYSDLLRPSKERLAEYAARQLALAWSHEGLVNLDMTLRERGGIVFCVYDNVTGENYGLDFTRQVRVEVSLLPCDEVSQYRASKTIADRFVNATVLPTAIPIPQDL